MQVAANTRANTSRTCRSEGNRLLEALDELSDQPRSREFRRKLSH